jgi:urease accessory protein
MVAVGIIAVQIGGRALLSVPLAFLSAMIVGGTLGILGIQLPFVETGIALSVLILGGIIAGSKKLPSSIAIACIALFALFHGHAHGTDMLSAANPVLFTIGFISSTALLHIAGIITGVYAKKTALSLRLLKTSGLAISLTGIALLLGF